MEGRREGGREGGRKEGKKERKKEKEKIILLGTMSNHIVSLIWCGPVIRVSEVPGTVLTNVDVFVMGVMHSNLSPNSPLIKCLCLICKVVFFNLQCSQLVLPS